MTERSLFPMACAAAGLSLPAVLDALVNEAYAAVPVSRFARTEVFSERFPHL